MPHAIVSVTQSSSFPDDDPLHANAVSVDQADIVLFLRGATPLPDATKTVILVELDKECLGDLTGEDRGEEGSNLIGFARYQNGSDKPSALVELVVQKNTPPEAITSARDLFASVGLVTAVCTDQVGRIVDRLVRPKYNAALRLLDEGLATQVDIDLTCRSGLGYPDGPIERTIRGGLANHYDISAALFEAYGTPAYVPARRAAVAKRGERA